MRFRGILRGNDPEKLGQWLIDARTCGISSMKRFAQTLSRDLDAVKNARYGVNSLPTATPFSRPISTPLG